MARSVDAIRCQRPNAHDVHDHVPRVWWPIYNEPFHQCIDQPASVFHKALIELKVLRESRTTYGGIKLGAVSKIIGSRELLAYGDSGAKQHRLTHAHDATCGVIERQWGIENIIIPEAHGIVYAGGNEQVTGRKKGE